MGWSEIEIAGHPAELFEPAERSPHGYALIYLHGVHGGRLSDSAAYTAELERQGLVCVGPRSGRSWWTDRICPEFDPRVSAERHVIEHVLPLVAERFAAAPPRIGLWGTSMGGQGALRLAFKRPDTFPVVAGVSPAIDYQQVFDVDEGAMLREMYESAEHARQDTATLHVHPLNWPRNTFFCSDPADDDWHESAQRLQMKLYALGVPHECDLSTSAGGHGFNYYNHMAPTVIGFLVERLEQERLRVV